MLFWSTLYGFHKTFHNKWCLDKTIGQIDSGLERGFVKTLAKLLLNNWPQEPWLLLALKVLNSVDFTIFKVTLSSYSAQGISSLFPKFKLNHSYYMLLRRVRIKRVIYCIQFPNNGTTKTRWCRPKRAKVLRKPPIFRLGYKVRNSDVSLLLFLTPK